MKVYLQGSMLGEEYAGRLVGAEVTAVHAAGLDLLLEDGARLIDWRGKVYDETEREIAPERVRRDFMPSDPAALLARLQALEVLLTEV